LFRQINRFFQITPHERRRQFAVVPPQHFLGHPPGTDIVIQGPRGGRTALHKPVHVRQRVCVGDLSHTAPDLFANLFVRALVVDPKRGFGPVCGPTTNVHNKNNHRNHHKNNHTVLVGGNGKNKNNNKKNHQKNHQKNHKTQPQEQQQKNNNTRTTTTQEQQPQEQHNNNQNNNHKNKNKNNHTNTTYRSWLVPSYLVFDFY
jgi:hypothetical protein